MATPAVQPYKSRLCRRATHDADHGDNQTDLFGECFLQRDRGSASKKLSRSTDGGPPRTFIGSAKPGTLFRLNTAVMRATSPYQQYFSGSAMTAYTPRLVRILCVQSRCEVCMTLHICFMIKKLQQLYFISK